MWFGLRRPKVPRSYKLREFERQLHLEELHRRVQVKLAGNDFNVLGEVGTKNFDEVSRLHLQVVKKKGVLVSAEGIEPSTY